MAKGKEYGEDEMLEVLKEIEGGASIASVARAHGTTDQTLYRWRERYGACRVRSRRNSGSWRRRTSGSSGSWLVRPYQIDTYKEVAQGKG